MRVEAKIQKWGNGQGLRLSSKLLAVAGIERESEVDLLIEEGKIVIQSREKSLEQAFDQIFADEPGAAELLAEVKTGLEKAIALTEETTARCDSLNRYLEGSR